NGFRVINAALAAVLILSQVSFIPLHVRLLPQVAELWVDDAQIRQSSGHWSSDNVYEYDLNVRFRPVDLTVKPPHNWGVKDPDMEQTFHVGWGHVLGALISSSTYELSILWPVTVTASQ